MSFLLFRPDGGEPVEYTIKVSSRARHARLKMMPHAGLVVVVPKKYSQGRIESLLREHEAWIRKTAERMDAHRPEPLPSHDNGLPKLISFRHVAEEWNVVYRADISRTKADMQQMTLFLPALPQEGERCRRLLLSWVRQRAASELLPLLAELAETRGFNYSGAGVRLLHSRWGSCSSRRVISLNTKLLFLPEPLVRHIMLHELCHTVHMDHSRSFRELLRRHDPLSKLSERELKTAWKYVPDWVVMRP
jgi:predicted metal-dependent hydrolase